MKVRLLRDVKIRHRAGEVIDVADPAELGFLLNMHSAEPVRTAPAPAEPEEKPAEKPAAKPAAKTAAKPAARTARKTAK